MLGSRHATRLSGDHMDQEQNPAGGGTPRGADCSAQGQGNFFSPNLTETPAVSVRKTALEQLKATRKWVAWTYKQRGRGKPTKPPVNPHTGAAASVADPATWGTWEQATERATIDSLAGV